MYFPCGGPGTESPHMQRGPCYPLSDVKMAGVPPGGNLKNIIIKLLVLRLRESW